MQIVGTVRSIKLSREMRWVPAYCSQGRAWRPPGGVVVGRRRVPLEVMLSRGAWRGDLTSDEDVKATVRGRYVAP